MDLKKRITKGRIEHEPTVLIYGGDGVGKSAMCAGAPNPFFIDVNKGSLAYNVNRVLPESWDEVKECLDAVERREIDCGTVVIDSVTDLEMLLHKHLFQGVGIDAWNGGYGKGDTAALMEFRALLSQLERIWFQGKAIALVAHMVVKRFEDPTGPAFERFEVSCRPKLAGLLRQWVSYVLFCREEVAIAGGKNEHSRAVTTNTR